MNFVSLGLDEVIFDIPFFTWGNRIYRDQIEDLMLYCSGDLSDPADQTVDQICLVTRLEVKI